jgi:ubiquinone biosynthesis accessory factor UbiJ
MLSGPAAAAINHLLCNADWARARLEPFAGRSVRLEISPLSAVFTVGADGRLLPSGSHADSGTVVRLTASALIRLLWLHDETARQEVQVEGDAAFASALTSVLSGLRWDVEEDLSQIVGDVAAHRLAQAGTGLFAWHAKVASNLTHALAEYWTEEQPLLVGSDTLRQFLQAVDALRDDAERLEKRIERTRRLVTPRTGG